MKIKDVINEAEVSLSKQLSQARQREKQAGQNLSQLKTQQGADAELAGKITNAENALLTRVNELLAAGQGKQIPPAAQQQVDRIRSEAGLHPVDWKTGKVAVEPSEFVKQFSIVDDNPVTIQWNKQLFQRKDGTGTWVNFPGGKPASQQMILALDKVSPLPNTNEPKPAVGGVKAISVTDNAGVVWTKDEDNNRWLNDSGTVANPENSKQLEKRAITQYQARQMGA